MILYAIIMVVAAVPTGVLAALIYKGKTNLIHDYHRTKVTDKTGYGKAFGKAMSLIAAGMALSGVIALFGESLMLAAMIVLTAGLVAGIVAIVLVQKKYNGGVF